jgi:lysophospholipase L1-like esterase
MAGKSGRKRQVPDAIDAFAKMSRSVVDAPVRGPAGKRVRRKGKAARGKPVADLSTAAARDKAAALAVRLGKSQAEWVIERRKARLRSRVRAIRKTTAKKSVAKKGAKKVAKKGGGVPASLGVLVAEGDSWFDYPFYDVLKLLEDEHGFDVEAVSHRGDSVESMAYDGGQLEDFVRTIERVVRRGQVPRAVLLSGGGNDVAGDGFALLLNHRSSPTNGINAAVLEGVVETRIVVAYTTIIAAVTQACVEIVGAPVPIVLHGYDYPVPDGRGFLGGFGWLPGPWLEPGFREKGYEDLQERVDIARVLIDRFNGALQTVAATAGFSHVRVLDLRDSLSTTLANDRYKDWWGNELHPTFDGFSVIADRFAQVV